MLTFLIYLLDWSTRRASTFDKNITISAIKSCLNVLSTSVSIVVADSGNLEDLQKIRKLHRQEVDTSSSTIAGLVCALFPRCPIESDIETREACHIPVKLIFKDYYNAVKVIRDDGREEIL
ncbi:5710_t:CDS:2, partial [Cetraspora pellucida]